MKRAPLCDDCAFKGVEPAICDECVDANQFQELENDETPTATPIYFIDWKD